MTAFAWIFLLAASTSVDLVDEVYQIPAAEWKYIPISLRQEPALVSASFDVPAGGGQVRLALMTLADLEHFRNDLAHGVLALTAVGNSGSLRYRVPEPAEYVLVIDNRAAGSHRTAVHLRVALDFGRTMEPVITQITPRRQLTVIVLSFAFFFGVVTYSARKLLRIARK